MSDHAPRYGPGPGERHHNVLPPVRRRLSRARKREDRRGDLLFCTLMVALAGAILSICAIAIATQIHSELPRSVDARVGQKLARLHCTLLNSGARGPIVFSCFPGKSGGKS
jgi:hypothetical protein